ncbi:MAG: putative PEP-binding protein [Candidatus Dormibacteraceae bacterium]
MDLTGVGASPGMARGPTFLVLEAPPHAAPGQSGVAAVRAAMARAGEQLEQLAAQVRERNPEGADVLEVQAMLARDPAVEPAIERGIAAGQDSALAVREAFDEQAAGLESLGEDSYLGARGADVREAGRAVVAALTGRRSTRLQGLVSPSIVVARDLAPADTLAVPPALLLGLVTETGGMTSHAAIVARELGVPAVLGAAGALAAARDARSAEIDGRAGTVRFSASEVEAQEPAAAAGTASPQTWLPLLGNAGSAAGVHAAAQRGAQGIGLLRTEFFYLGRSGAPSESEQLATLLDACAAFRPHPITVRTLDAGSDKALPYLEQASEPNPALGRRGVRLWLAHDEVARTQARALLQAHATHGTLRVMVPMVAARTEIDAVRALFADEADRLSTTLPPLGIMVETPAAAACLPAFAGAIDFVSLGTNDLAQYSAGADRELTWPPELREWNPGTLRLIARALADARTLGIDAGVCGELAGSPGGAVLLAGLGATSLSMSASSLQEVAAALNRLGRDACAAAAEAALGERSAAGAWQAVRDRLG